MKPDLIISCRSGRETKHRRVCTEVNKLGGAALVSWGLRLWEDASGKPLEPPPPGSSRSAHLVTPRRLPTPQDPGRLPHLHQPAVPGNKVDRELFLPAHHARRLCAVVAAAAAATATSFSPRSRRDAAPTPSARLP